MLDVVAKDERHFFVMAGYVFKLNKNIKMAPSLLVKYVNNAPLDFDINGSLIFFDRFWAGISYRLNDSVDGLLQYQLNNQLRLGLAYDYTLTELQRVNNGSFEIMLEYVFQFDKEQINNLRFF